MSLTTALSLVDEQSSELLATLERWVRINSFSRDVAAVNRMGAQLEEDFAPLAMSFQRHRTGELGDHLFWSSAAWPGSPARSRVLLVGHHDTVFPPGTFETFEVAGDRVAGPGVLDMKGGLLVVWAALRALAGTNLLDAMPVALICVGDEEIGSPTSRDLLESEGRDAGYALVFEAGRAEDRIITRRKGTGGLHITVTGKAAHAGNNHADGINAIAAVARLVTAIEGLTDYDRGVTLNVGLCSGGESRNTVPRHATCEVDMRFLTASDGHALVAEVDRAARAIAEQTGAKITLEGGVRRPPLERTEASAELCRLYGRCAIEHGLGGEEADLIGGGSDANTLSAIGVPAIDGLGPRGKGFHTHDEYIEWPTVVPRIKTLVSTLVALTS